MANIKRTIRRLLPESVGDFLSNIYGQRLIKKWKQKGSIPPAPNHLKQKVIADIQKKWARECFVETGTYQGDMIHAQKKNFQKLISIELNTGFHQAAVQRFAKESHIEIFQGDSADVLSKIDFPSSSLFWLDAHYSGGATAKGELECPIYAEFDAIDWQAGESIVLIDDARCFNGTHDYPKLEDLRKYLLQKTDSYSMETKDDIIHIMPI